MTDPKQQPNRDPSSVRRVRKRRKVSGSDSSRTTSIATRQRIREQLAGRDLDTALPSSKRRRRKSEKQSRKSRKGRFILLSVVTIGGFSLALGYAFALSYHNSQTFKKRLELASASATGATVAIKQLDVEPTSASAQSASWSWVTSPSLLQSCELTELSSRHSTLSLLMGRWSPSGVKSQSGRLVVDFSALPEKGFRLFESQLPVFIHCKQVDVFQDKSETKWIEGAQVNVTSDSLKQQIILSGGVLHSPLFDRFVIDHGLVSCQQKTVTLAARFNEIQGSGSLLLRAKKAEGDTHPLIFELDIEHLDSAQLLNEELATHFLAKFSATGGEFTYSHSGDHSYRLKLRSDRVKINGLDCFSVLSEIMGKTAYKTPSFGSKCSAVLIKDHSGYLLKEIQLEEAGSLRISGSLKADDAGEITGTLEIGVPLAAKPQLESQFKDGVFAQESGGYLWQQITVKGGQEGWSDSMRSLLRSSVPELKASEKSLELQFEELLRN